MVVSYGPKHDSFIRFPSLAPFWIYRSRLRTQHTTYNDIVFLRIFTMAAPAEPTGTPIEALFRPSTRLRDELEDLPRRFHGRFYR
jgi:hypothetical protein